ncbi:S8 family serine peptidase [Sedimentibacter sp. zth1]|uniref:S8 family serine peptidase n=1 Tax=Sedimentibacter sp. zth1 TaxID=2816908 RepID=UPI001A93637C|nr:S8 family serine peptidase [Sedimentibacter sp. zth1]QSX05986.1 S8 family serine peptidase [Sedimentibacter sp. zth1]
MLSNLKVKKNFAVLLTLLMLISMIPSFAYANDSNISSAKEELKQEALSKITPEVMNDFDEDLIEVLVYMKEQVDTEMIAEATKSAVSDVMTPYNIKLEVRKGVVEALKDEATTTQKNIIKYLDQEMDKGNVEEFTSYHIVNMIYVKATKEVIENISFMSEVEKIYKNKVHTLEVTEMSEEIKPTTEGIEWNIEKVNADQTWELGIDGSGVVVGSLDSGVDWTHPAIKNKWRGYDPSTGETNPEGSWFDPVYNSTLPEDSDEHGTHVMGTVLGQEEDGSNKIGVAPGARWIAARVFNTSGSTTGTILLSAAEWMLQPNGDPANAPDVVNNSWGGGSGIDEWYRDAVRNWRAAGIFPVFSAGNQRAGEPAPWPGSISCPANYPESFAVAATDINNMRASFSKLGPSPYDESLIKPEISAPGVSIRSSIPGGGYQGGWSGTSMSAPHITGTVALLLSANASLTVDDIDEVIKSTAMPLVDTSYPTAPNMSYGYGLVDTFEAVSQVASGTGYISGKVLVPGEDTSEPVINHEQMVTEIYIGSDTDIIAEISDDVAITEVELLVKQEGKSYWMLTPMNRISGDHKAGIYKGTISYDMLGGNSITYKIKARDYGGDAIVSPNYNIEVKFGIVPDEYTQGFEGGVEGWIFGGEWEYGVPSGTSPEAYEGEKLAGTKIAENYANGANSLLVTPPIDLRNADLGSATLRFQEWYETENNYDKCYVYVTNDYGSTWTQVGPIRTGNVTEWMETVINLNEYIGCLDPVFVGFRFTSDSSNVKPGWFIDNVRLIGVDTEAPATPMDLVAEATLTGIKLNWTAVDDSDVSHYNVYRSLTSGEGYEFIANASSNMFIDTTLEAGITYYYKVAAVDISENTSELSEEVFGQISETTVLFSTDFENDDAGFVTGVTAGTENPWELGIPTSGSNEATSGVNLWATNLEGNYEHRTDAYIQSPTIQIPADINAVLTFNHWVDMEGTSTLYDYGQVQISKDNGSTWTNITPVTGGKYGKRVQAWANEEIALEGYNGETINIRFLFHSDGSGAYTGWYIDDVVVLGMDTTPEALAEQINLEKEEEPEVKKADYVDPEELSYSLKKDKTNNYVTIEDEEVQNMQAAYVGGIPATDAVVTVLETGRSVKVNPVNGKFYMRHVLGENFTLRAEAYGYYANEVTVNVNEDETTRVNIMLEPKPQGTIIGRVFDRYYNNGAANAVIRVVEDPKVAPVVADEDGYFRINKVYEGTYTLKVVADGFEPGEITVDVYEDEITNVDIPLKRFVGYEDDIIYDDGVGENALVLNSAGYGLAVRFTPEQYGKVKGANVFFWDNSWPSPGGNRIGFAIYGIDDNGAPYQVGDPIFVDVIRGEFNYIDLSSLGFSTDRDFYISTIQDAAGSSCPGTGIDENSPYGDRSYLNLGGEFKLISEENIQGGIMIRARMEYSVAVPVITNLNELTYTNQDSITVEGTVTADGKVNVYLNGEKVTTVDTENKEFAVEINLPLDENTIMVTAEMDGIETEPSSAVTVIKDKIAPELIVEEPEDNLKINEEVVHVVGNVQDNIEITQLLINEVEVAIDEDGNFHERLMVNQGVNIITVKAIDIAGNETVIERTVTVELTEPEITNILPAEDLELYVDDILTVSFNAPTGGEGYFRLLLPFETSDNNIGIPMTEEDGVYTGTWTVPEGFVATDLQVEVVYVSQYGTTVSEIAEGRVTLIGRMEDLPESTIIINGEAFDMNFINSNPEGQIKLIEWLNSGNQAYVKLDKNTIVDMEGEIISIELLPQRITYIDMSGNITFYEK